MPDGEISEQKERELLEEYIQSILNALEVIFKEGQTSLKAIRLLTKKINAHLQKKYPNYMFNVELNPLSNPHLPMGIALRSAEFTQYSENYLAEPRRCKWCDGILD